MGIRGETGTAGVDDRIGNKIKTRELFTEVEVLDESEFIDRYARILGLRDNVTLTRTNIISGIGLVANMLLVRPDTYESRLKADVTLRDAYRRIGAPHAIDSMWPVEHPKSSMTDEEVVDLAERIRTIRAKQELYSQLNPLHRLGHNVLLLMGRESLSASEEETRLANLPDVISFAHDGTGITELIVNSAAVDPTRFE